MTDVELTISADRREPGSARLAGTLTLVAALSGVVLAVVFQITKPVIDANKARELRAAVFEVVPGAATVVSRDQDANPVLLTNGYGAGRVVCALPIVEASMAEVADNRQTRARWQKWYEGMLGLL